MKETPTRYLARILWEETKVPCNVTATTYRNDDGTEENFLRFHTACYGDSPLFTKVEDALNYFNEVIVG